MLSAVGNDCQPSIAVCGTSNQYSCVYVELDLVKRLPPLTNLFTLAGQGNGKEGKATVKKILSGARQVLPILTVISEVHPVAEVCALAILNLLTPSTFVQRE